MLRRQNQSTGSPVLKQRSSILERIIADRVYMICNKNFANMIKRLNPRATPFWKLAKILRKKPRPVLPLKFNDIVVITAPKKSSVLVNQIIQAHQLGSIINSPQEADIAASILQLNHQLLTPSLEAHVSRIKVKGALTTLANIKAPRFNAILNLLLKRLPSRALQLPANIFSKCFKLGYSP